MAKRKARRRREAVDTADYADSEGNVLRLRTSLSGGTIAKIKRQSGRPGASPDDIWRRRGELMFERLAVNWMIAGLPLTDQKMLLARYRMADPEMQRWVRETIDRHVEKYIPELSQGL